MICCAICSSLADSESHRGPPAAVARFLLKENAMPKRILLLPVLLLTQPVLAASPATPPAVFAQCAACHSVTGSNGVGPSLQGVIGRKAGTFPGFRYSRAMKSYGKVWDKTTLAAYLANPQQAVPGNTMPFAGVPDAAQRNAIITYLASVK
jgi:cytochrome c